MPNKGINKLNFNILDFLKERQSFLIALLFACLFWFGTKLSQNLQHTLPLEVNYILPQGFAIKSPVPKTIEVSFEGVGWNLFFLKSQAKSRKIDINLQNRSSQVLSTEHLKEAVISKFGTGDIHVASVNPTQLYVELEARLVKNIPIRLEKTYSLAQGYSVASGFILNPDSIQIDGPKSKVDKYTHWSTDKVELLDLSKDVSMEIDLVANKDSLISVSNVKTQLDLQVEKATEKTLEVPIFIPPSFADQIKIIPSKVELICQTGLSNYDKINPENFRIELPSYSFKKLIETPQVDLKITISPDKASHIRLNPNTVEVYIIDN